MWCQYVPNRSVTALGVPEVAGILDDRRFHFTGSTAPDGLL
ncbi:uncharacterized protein METZ01_LOCUS486891 [marine metagenome]|uniref:Uncharacterized protein n=1 Tax=marine metagenome TaxID=408172 RepID=A0A383CNV4_9ZZZZ